MKKALSIGLSALLTVACSRPLLVVDQSLPTADVQFTNGSTGYLQQFFFDDPVTCDGAKLIAYSVQPHESKNHKIPAGQIVTIWTSGWGLPAAPGMVAWCRPSAFSTQLNPGQAYEVRFVADPEKRLCGTVLTTPSGATVPRIERAVSGPEIGGGAVTAGPMSCAASDDLSSLK